MLIADTLRSRSGYYLDSLLAPLAPWLQRDDVTDIYINRPEEIWIEALGGTVETHSCPTLTEQVLARLARQVAAASAQGISREHPLLAAILPDGSRVQVVAPPATRSGHALAIRRHVAAGVSIEDYEREGRFNRAGLFNPAFETDRRLQAVMPGDIAARLRRAVRERSNILVSGGTSSGKTTFINALLKEIPADERLILIEDTPELELVHRNAVGLIAARSALGEADVSAEDLLMASLRMRPDRIILGELRGREAFTFLRAVNSGHPGSMTTIHADTPERAVEQLTLQVLQAGSQLSREDIRHYARASLDVFVQLGRVDDSRQVVQLLARENS